MTGTIGDQVAGPDRVLVVLDVALADVRSGAIGVYQEVAIQSPTVAHDLEMLTQIIEAPPGRDALWLALQSATREQLDHMLDQVSSCQHANVSLSRGLGYRVDLSGSNRESGTANTFAEALRKANR